MLVEPLFCVCGLSRRLWARLSNPAGAGGEGLRKSFPYAKVTEMDAVQFKELITKKYGHRRYVQQRELKVQQIEAGAVGAMSDRTPGVWRPNP